MRVGIAGCGMIAGAPLREGRPIATNHAAACRSLAEVELVAAADPDPDRRRVFADYWSVPAVFRSVDEMLETARPDVLVVATPAEHHEEACLSGLRFGVKGTLCEKPLGGRHDVASRIVEAYRSKGVPLAVNFMRRWDSSHRELARAISSSELGAMRVGFGTYTGTLRGNGSHLIDLLGALLPSDEAWDVRDVELNGPASDLHDGPVSALLERGGVRVSIEPIWQAEYFVFELVLYGTLGRARLLASGNDIRLDFPAPSPRYPGYRYLEERRALPSETLPAAFASALEAVVRAVRDGTPLAVPAHVHLEGLKIVDRLLAKARTQP